MKSYVSNAKINLGLQVLNKRNDGYHNIYSHFIEIDLSDKLFFLKSDKYKLTAEGLYSKFIPLNNTNLISKAYYLLRQIKPSLNEYSIHLMKNIPIGGGLGGGSSNAAKTLKVLNQLWNLNLTDDELISVGKELGADIPFFIKGGFQLVEGIGDILKKININFLENLIFVLIVPNLQISTKIAYQEINKTLEYNKSCNKFPTLSKPMKWELFDNDFERVIHGTYPEIRQIKVKLKNMGALYSGLSGSGSTVFGVFNNHFDTQFIYASFSKYKVFITAPVFH